MRNGKILITYVNYLLFFSFFLCLLLSNNNKITNFILFVYNRALGITAMGLIVVKLVSVFTGLIIFAKYYDCDPLLAKVRENRSVRYIYLLYGYYINRIISNIVIFSTFFFSLACYSEGNKKGRPSLTLLRNGRGRKCTRTARFVLSRSCKRSPCHNERELEHDVRYDL